MISKSINKVAINVSGPCWLVQPSGSRQHQAQGCSPEQALGSPQPFNQTSLGEALQVEDDPGTIGATRCAARIAAIQPTPVVWAKPRSEGELMGGCFMRPDVVPIVGHA